MVGVRDDAAESNREVFDSATAVGDYQSGFGSTGYLDAGERAALLRVADDVRGQAVLDIGVGVGRTTTLLRLLTDRYEAADYAPHMRGIPPQLPGDPGRRCRRPRSGRVRGRSVRVDRFRQQRDR